MPSHSRLGRGLAGQGVSLPYPSRASRTRLGKVIRVSWESKSLGTSVVMRVVGSPAENTGQVRTTSSDTGQVCRGE